MKNLKNLTLITALVLAFTVKSYCQDDFNNVLSKIDKNSYQGLTNAFSADINAGLFHTAKIEKGFSLYIGVKAFSTGLNITSNSVKITSVPFAVPQLNLGSVFHTDVMVRFMPAIKISKYGSVGTWGIGIRHCITGYFKKSPIDASVQFAYQKLNINDSKDNSLVNSSSIAANLQLSKTLSVFTFYTGVQYEKTNISLNYNNEGTQTSMAFDNQNIFKAVIGLDLKLGPLNLNGDYNIGKNSTFSAGFGFAF